MQLIKLELTLVTGVILAGIIAVSVCFYVPLILLAWDLDDYTLLACATGLELCLALLLFAGYRTRGWRG